MRQPARLRLPELAATTFERHDELIVRKLKRTFQTPCYCGHRLTLSPSDNFAV